MWWKSKRPRLCLVYQLVITVVSLGYFDMAYAESRSKAEVLIGGFTFNAETTTSSGSVSGFGSYRAAFRQTIMQSRFEIIAGYSLFTSEITGGDLGFGPEIGILYYPMTQPQAVHYDTPETIVFLTDKWRPAIGGGFYQRQFQSVNSSYAGFGVMISCEYAFQPKLNFKAELRYQSLLGPNESTATFLDALFGIVLPL